MADEAVKHPNRRNRNPCPGCERYFIPKSSRNRFCPVLRKTKPRDPSHYRKYGPGHRRLRSQWATRVAAGAFDGGAQGWARWSACVVERELENLVSATREALALGLVGVELEGEERAA